MLMLELELGGVLVELITAKEVRHLIRRIVSRFDLYFERWCRRHKCYEARPLMGFEAG